MPNFQLTFIFNQERYGWTETWYWFGNTHDDAIAPATNYGTRRAGLLGIGATIEAVRISDVDIVGDAKLIPLGLDGQGQGLNADTPWNAIYVRVQNGALYRRQMWLRGIPDDWIELTNGRPNANPVKAALTAALASVRSSLLANVFLLKVIDKSAGNGTPINNTALTADAQGRLQFNIAGITGGVGSTIRIKGFSGPDAGILNKVWKVVANDGTKVTVAFQFANLADPLADVGGKGVARVTLYLPVSTVVLQRAAKRSTGRAFFVARGRRRKA